MSILYAMKMVNNSLKGQKGPTCWYYAAKMVAECHEEEWPLADQKWASLLRKISTYAETNKGKKLTEMTSMELNDTHTSFLETCNKHKLHFNSALDKTSYMALEAEYKWDLLPDSKSNFFNQKLTPKPSIIRQQDLPLPSALQGSLSQLGRQLEANKKNKTRRFNDFDEVVQILSEHNHPDLVEYYESQIKSCFVSIPQYSSESIKTFSEAFEGWRATGFNRANILEKLGFKQLTKMEILNALNNINLFEKLLKTKGPLWCGSRLGASQTASKGPAQKVAALGNLAIVNRDLGIQEIPHAIAICGVSTKLNRVYYRDPNISKHMLWSVFSALSSGITTDLKQESVGMMYYEKNEDGAVTCAKLEN